MRRYRTYLPLWGCLPGSLCARWGDLPFSLLLDLRLGFGRSKTRLRRTSSIAQMFYDVKSRIPPVPPTIGPAARRTSTAHAVHHHTSPPLHLSTFLYPPLIVSRTAQ